MADADRVIDILTDVARPIMLQHFRLDSCIAASREGQIVLEYFGVESYPVEVEVVAYNKLAFDALNEGVAPAWEDGAWSVGVTRTPKDVSLPDKKWYGAHVILTAGDYLIDLSADQLDRPKKNIQAAPVAVHLDMPRFVLGEPAFVQSDEPETTIIWKYLRPQDRSFQDSPDWKDRNRHKEPVGKIIRAIKRELEADPSSPG